jgi:hypothetical protein
MSGSLGLTVARDRVVAVLVRRTARGPRVFGRWERPLAAGPAEGAWPELLEALRGLPETLAGATEVSVALHRSLGHARTITVPRLPRAELRGLVTRHARRYFLSAADPSLADAVPERAGRRGTPVRALASCAETAVVEAVLATLAEAGLRCVALTPASCALAEAVRSLVPASRQAPVVIAVDCDGWQEGMAMRGRTILAVEPWVGPEDGDLAVSAARLAESAFGPASARGPLSVVPLVGARTAPAGEGFSGAAFALLRLPAGMDALDAVALAAFGATLSAADTPQLFPQRMWQETARAEWLRATLLAVVAAAALTAAGAAHLWGLRRELAAVASERRAHAEAVETALAIEREIQGTRLRLEAVRRAEAGVSRWSRVLVSVAQTLPDSAFLVAFTAESTRVRLDGVAPAAASVAGALSHSALLGDVTLVSAFRTPGAEDVERFALTVAVRPGSPAVAPAAPEGGQ